MKGKCVLSNSSDEIFTYQLNFREFYESPIICVANSDIVTFYENNFIENKINFTKCSHLFV